MVGLTAGLTDSSSLNVGLSTAAAGNYNGNVIVGFVSADSDLADKALGTQSVVLKAQVNNYAKGDFKKTGGSGSLIFDGTAYTLDFGTLVKGSGVANNLLDVLNLSLIHI